jgi:hypothetical protein
MTTFEEWKTVPDVVAELFPQAMRLRDAYEKLAEYTGDLAGTLATWRTADNVLVLYRPDDRTIKSADATVVTKNIKTVQPDWSKEILIKKAALPYVAPAFDFLNKSLGATPLSNGIVSSLMLGGLGYGAGALAENLFPERYVRRGVLRRNLGLAGAAAGLGFGAHNAYATSKKMRQGFWKSLVTPNNTPVPLLPPDEKQGFNAFNPAYSNSLFESIVDVPQFNTSAWNDARLAQYTGNPMFTPPAYAAAATGLMSGISTAQRSPIIRPIDVINGIASAGVGLATANVAGRALSAMAGLTPAGQQKLQDMGLWGGMMHAIVPTIFGR